MRYSLHGRPGAAHSCSLHDSLIDKSVGQAVPLPIGCCVIMRMRDRRPPPHVAEHALHVLHCATSQLTGHSCGLHTCDSDNGGQSPADVVTLRDRTCDPEPHDFEHALNCDHALTWHMHGAFMHGLVSSNAPHDVPPFDGGTTTPRVRFCSPVPHDCEHVPQFDHALN